MTLMRLTNLQQPKLRGLCPAQQSSWWLHLHLSRGQEPLRGEDHRPYGLTLSKSPFDIFSSISLNNVPVSCCSMASLLCGTHLAVLQCHCILAGCHCLLPSNYESLFLLLPILLLIFHFEPTEISRFCKHRNNSAIDHRFLVKQARN